ncbi:MAG: hypothetical protein ORN85_06790 [Sediminibacterium sp.]|nr:hypothetical protein [Sediminibacterium sp.]
MRKKIIKFHKKLYYKNIIFVLFFNIFSLSHSYSQRQPEWITNQESLYPKSSYLTVFNKILNNNHKDVSDFLANLILNAQAELSQSISIQIKVSAEQKVTQENKQFSQHFQQQSNTQTRISLQGLKSLTYYDVKDDYGYVLLYLERKPAIDFYKTEINKSIELQNKLLASLNENIDLSSKLKFFLETKNNIEENRQNLLILQTLYANNGSKNDADYNSLNSAFQQLESVVEQNIITIKTDIEVKYKKQILAKLTDDINAELNTVNTLLKNSAQIRETNIVKYIEMVYQATFQLRNAIKIKQEITTIILNTNDVSFKSVFEKIEDAKKTCQELLFSLISNPNLGLDGLITLIAFHLKFFTLENRTFTQPVFIQYFTLESKKISTAFSEKCFQQLKPKLQQIIGWHTANYSDLISSDATIIKGYYVENKANLNIHIELISQEQVLNSFDVVISKEYLDQENIAYKPTNYNDFKSTQNFLESSNNNNSELELNVTTNKGDDNLVFKEDEELKLFISSNKTCFIDVIYIFADGTKVLLLKNYKFQPREDKQPTSLPFNFICAEPFGAESLILLASEQRLSDIATKSESGYEIITSDFKNTYLNLQRSTNLFSKTLYITTLPK